MSKPRPKKYQWMHRMGVGTYCTTCKTHTKGIGTEARPYKCDCGEWMYGEAAKQFSLVKCDTK